MGWQSILPFLTDKQVSKFAAKASAGERAQPDEWFDIEQGIDPRPARHVLSASLFWKHVDIGNPDLPTPTLDLLQNARSLA